MSEDFKHIVERVLAKGEKTSHIHLIRVENEKNKVEFIVKQGKVTQASLTMGQRTEILNRSEVSVIEKHLNIFLDDTQPEVYEY
jgi:hypothetical protein